MNLKTLTQEVSVILGTGDTAAILIQLLQSGNLQSRELPTLSSRQRQTKHIYVLGDDHDVEKKEKAIWGNGDEEDATMLLSGVENL